MQVDESRKREGVLSLEVTIREGESQDSLLRRFQINVQMSGILREAKTRRRFISRRDAAIIKAKNNARRKRINVNR